MHVGMGRTRKVGGQHEPHLPPVCAADMHLEITPSGRSNVIASGVGTVEAEEQHRFLHHFLGFEEDAELRILERDHIRGIRREVGVGGDGKDHRKLGLLVKVAFSMEEGRIQGELALQNVHSIFL
jgi:hypothetical protein